MPSALRVQKAVLPHSPASFSSAALRAYLPTLITARDIATNRDPVGYGSHIVSEGALYFLIKAIPLPLLFKAFHLSSPYFHWSNLCLCLLVCIFKMTHFLLLSNVYF
jgi:hypothetical protein